MATTARPLAALCVLASLCACAPTETEPPAEIAVQERDPRVRVFVDTAPHRDDGVVESTVARYGDPIHLVVDGLFSGEAVSASFSSGAGTSSAIFLADKHGVVDLAAAVPESGSWSVADREGFLWSMRDPPLGPLDLSVVASFELPGEDGPDDDEALEVVVERRYTNQDILEDAVDDGRVIGVLATPPGDGPFGGVLCFGGSEGGTFSGVFCAQYLASLGYAALGIGYFGAPGLPPELEAVPLEQLEEALVYLVDDPRVSDDGVVVMGGSRGGELALLLGANFPIVSGVVAQVPSGYAWSSVNDVTAPAWTLDGEPVPFVPASPAAVAVMEIGRDGDEGLALTPAFEQDLADAPAAALEAASIPVENSNGPVLLLGGGDDRLWPSCTLAQAAFDRLVDAGHDDDWDDELVCLEGAGHAATLIPGWSAVGTTTSAYGNTPLLLGGTVADNGRASREADLRTRAFLERVLGAGLPPIIR